MVETLGEFANFLFSDAETCDIRTHWSIAHCSKHEVAPGVVVIAMAEQSIRENFLRQTSRDSGVFEMILLPEKHIAIDLTGEIFRSLGGNQWDWNKNAPVPTEFSGGKVYGCPVGNLVNAVRDWFKADLAAMAVQEVKKNPESIKYAKKDAYETFVKGLNAKEKVEKELNSVLTRDGYHSDMYFPSEIFFDYLLNNDRDDLKQQWAGKFMAPDFEYTVHNEAIRFGNWYLNFSEAYREYTNLPDDSSEKQYRELLHSIKNAQTVKCVFAGSDTTEKVQTIDIQRAILDYVSYANATVGYLPTAHKLSDLQQVQYRGKVIWEKI